MSKPKDCPKCKSKNVLKIEYGLPLDTDGLDSGVYLGGCEVSNLSPNWHCADCSWEWGGGSDGEYNNDNNEFSERFQKMNDNELIQAYNDDIKKRGWVSARGRFHTALREEFERRGMDFPKNS